jgi:DNA-directed RNA polymerase beta subunit
MRPDAVTLADIVSAASAGGGGFLEWITNRKNRRAIPHRMEQCGYVPVRNDLHRGQWIINGTRQVVYAREDLSIGDRFLAAQRLAR